MNPYGIAPPIPADFADVWNEDNADARDAYYADEAVRAGWCADCHEKPRYRQGRFCIGCKYLRHVATQEKP
jgi:hypothetical protein